MINRISGYGKVFLTILLSLLRLSEKTGMHIKNKRYLWRLLLCGKRHHLFNFCWPLPYLIAWF